MNHSLPKILNAPRLAAIIFLMSTTEFAHAQTETTQSAKIDLRYIVNIFGTNLGEVHTTITKEEHTFTINSTTKAEGAASFVMGGDLIQQCQFIAEADKVVSVSSDMEKIGRDSFKTSIKLDRSTNKIIFNNTDGDQKIDIPAGYVVDSCNFPFAAAFTNPNQLKNNTTYVLDGKKNRIKGYVFKSEIVEKLDTPIGSFNTTKITLERELNPEKKFIFWVAKEFPYFPLKMIDQRKSGSRIMSIKSIKDA